MTINYLTRNQIGFGERNYFPRNNVGYESLGLRVYKMALKYSPNRAGAQREYITK